MISKTLSIIVTSLLLISCGTAAGNIKVYSVQKEKGGLVRTQVDPPDVIAFAKAGGYLCESPNDFSETVSCTGGKVKVFKLVPEKGLVRTQANQVLSFGSAKGYLCASPSDFKVLLSQCSTGQKMDAIQGDPGPVPQELPFLEPEVVVENLQ